MTRKNMIAFLIHHYSLKQILIFSFSLLLLITTSTGIFIFVSATNLSNDIHDIATVKQPLMLHAIELENTLQNSTTALGLYLLTQEKTYKDRYLQSNDLLEKQFSKLKFNASNNKTSALLKNINLNISRYSSHKEKMIKLAEDPNENFPARKFFAETISPNSKNILENLTQILQSELEEEATIEHRQFYALISNLRYSWLNLMNGVRSFLTFRNDSTFAQISQSQQIVQDINKKLRQYSGLITLDQKNSFAHVKEAQEKIFINTKKLLEISKQDKWRMDSYVIRTELKPIINAINLDIERLIKQLKQDVIIQTQDINETIYTESILIISVTVIILIFGSFIAYASIKIVTSILEVIDDSVGKLSSGDLDFSMDLEAKGHLGDIAHIFNSFSAYLEQTFKNIYETSTKLNANTQSLSQLTDDTNTNVAAQSNETTTVADAMVQMAASVDDITQSTTQAADEATKASKASNHGVKTVQMATATINELSSEVLSATDVITVLADDCNHIGNMLNIIRDISGQTNLLALNAAIEAARAGEQGRGFAIVADEVRTLATRTNDSTEDIQKQIEKLQNTAQEAVRVMQNGSSLAQRSVDSSNQARDAFGTINQAISKIDMTSTQIATASEEQNAVTADMTHRVENISQLSTKTLNSSQSSASASYEIFVLASELHTMISQFTKENTQSTGTDNAASEEDDLF